MAKRKKATRAGAPSRRPGTTRGKTGAGKGRRARAAGKTRPKARGARPPKASARRAGAGKSTRAPSTRRPKAAAARPRAGGRPRNRLEDVTADVQRRWDIEEEDVPTPPSTLDLDRRASAARSGRAAEERKRREYTQTSPAITGGDVDADWEDAYAVGDEAATGDNPTPDQDTVEALGEAVGVDYEDSEELKSTPKIDRRDKKRWELDPASSEDYKERNKRKGQ